MKTARRLRVYLSSTFEDLKRYRAAVSEALERAGLEVARMEGYTAADERPLDLCLRDVAQSDIYVGIVAWRYGYQPPPHHGNPDHKSITELEYEQAERSQLRKLLFFAHSDTERDWDPRCKDSATGDADSAAKLARLRLRLAVEKTASFFRSPEELATLVLAAIMRSGATGRPYNIRARSANVVPRPALSRRVIDAVVGTPEAPGDHTVLSGAGGFGKTTIALDVCHEAEAVRAFPDALLWVTLGERPNVAQAIHDLHVDVTGTPPVVEGVDAVVAAIGLALRGRRSLLVVDDVWRADDLLPLLRIDGPRFLVTTRLRNLAEEAGHVSWHELQVDEMAEREAVDLLARGLPEGGRSAAAALRSLAARLGHWPLLLELANARIRQECKGGPNHLGAAVARVVRLFEERGILSFDRRNASERNAAITNSIGVGLDALEELGRGLADKAVELAVFPENTAIPVPVLSNLWDLDAMAVEEDVLRPLDGLSLVRWDRAADAVRVHMLVLRALATRLTASPGQPAAVHGRLLASWTDPRLLPHAYAWRWFGWHCARAGQSETLRRLLLDFAWLRLKLHQTGIDALTQEFQYVAPDESTLAVQHALETAAHVLARRPGEFATQLCGRLFGAMRPALLEFVNRPHAGAAPPWLRPLTPSLGVPGLVGVVQSGARVKAVGVSDDARFLVSADGEGVQTAWDVGSGTPMRQIAAAGSPVVAIDVGTDGRITSTCAHHIVTWDPTSGDEPCIVPRPDERPTQLRALPLEESEHVMWWGRVAGGRQWIAMTERMRNPKWSGDQHVCCAYVGDDEHPVRTAVRFEDHSLRAAVATPDGRRLITCSWPSRMRAWDLETGVLLGTIPGDQALAVACSRSSGLVATAAYSGLISVWNLEAVIAGHHAAAHSRPVADARISADETLGYTVSVDGTAITWDLATGTVLQSIAPEASSARDADWSVMTAMVDVEKGLVRFLVRDADFRWAVGEVHSYDLKSGASAAEGDLPLTQSGGYERIDTDALFRFRPPFDVPGSAGSQTALALSPDGSMGATAGPGHTVFLWDLHPLRLIASVGLDSTPQRAALTTGGRTLLVGDESGHVHILRLEAAIG